MPFAGHRLRYVFEGQGELGFGVWTYATNDPLEEVLAEGYFNGAHRDFRSGDLVFVGSTRQPITTRLLEDYGGPEDPSAPLGSTPAARPRRRG